MIITSVPDTPHGLKIAGFLYDQAGTGGRDVVFADEALAAIQAEQARAHWATKDRNDMLQQRDVLRKEADMLREKLASTPTLSDKLRGARDLAETRLVEIRDLQQQLQLAKGLAHDRLGQVQALQVSAGESSSEILRLQDELKAALANNAALSTLTTRLQQELREERAAYMALHQKCRPAHWTADDRPPSLADMALHAGDQFRKAEDCGAALGGTVAGMQEATRGLYDALANHGRTMGSDLAGELVRILSRLTAAIQQAPK